MSTELAALPPDASPARRQVYRDQIASDQTKIDKYTQEKTAIMKQAQALEQLRDAAQRQGKPFGVAVIFLQVAILISSIAALFKRKAIWFVALPIGLLGLAYFADGFLLFF
jgi:hypothetical protein